MSGPVERRQALRFPITLPVDLERGTGITRNISTSGVLFETDQVFPTGALIQLTVLMEPTCPGTPACLHCQGQIVRAEQHEEKMGVAVAFTSYRFETLRSPGER
ncbi:MAG: PilZ domain-containing protein [Deltaproteobacteria bacterium]|nr:PilZ domain-containing protein [Deltaproteobacteria bacterium]